MSVLVPVKISCSNCGWYVITMQGDVIIPGHPALIHKCPECGESKMVRSSPSTMETLNPLTRARSAWNQLKGRIPRGK